MWLHSLKVAQLLRSAACLHTNQSQSYLNHLVYVILQALYVISAGKIKIPRTYTKNKHFFSAILSVVSEGLLSSSVGMYLLPPARISKTSLQITI